MWAGFLEKHTFQYLNIRSVALQYRLLGEKFFNLIIAVDLCKLDKLGLGNHIDETIADAVTYANDLIQFSTSLVCMQEMLDLCLKSYLL